MARPTPNTVHSQNDTCGPSSVGSKMAFVRIMIAEMMSHAVRPASTVLPRWSRRLLRSMSWKVQPIHSTPHRANPTRPIRATTLRCELCGFRRGVSSFVETP